MMVNALDLDGCLFISVKKQLVCEGSFRDDFVAAAVAASVRLVPQLPICPLKTFRYSLAP